MVLVFFYFWFALFVFWVFWWKAIFTDLCRAKVSQVATTSNRLGLLQEYWKRYVLSSPRSAYSCCSNFTQKEKFKKVLFFSIWNVNSLLSVSPKTFCVSLYILYQLIKIWEAQNNFLKFDLLLSIFQCTSIFKFPF